MNTKPPKLQVFLHSSQTAATAATAATVKEKLNNINEYCCCGYLLRMELLREQNKENNTERFIFLMDNLMTNADIRRL
jgi:hypothetical protein